jgi:dihydroxyacid dehydratase/phosphogluconate dehydratase
VREGDLISLDLDARTIELEVGAEEMVHRRESPLPPRRAIASPWLRRYRALVTNAACGAVLRDGDELLAASEVRTLETTHPIGRTAGRIS